MTKNSDVPAKAVTFRRNHRSTSSDSTVIIRRKPRSRSVGIRICNLLSNLAAVLTIRGDLEAARAAFIRLLDLSRTLGNEGEIDHALDFAAALAAASHAHELAARLHGAAGALARDSGEQHEPLDQRFTDEWLARSRADLGEARFDAAAKAGSVLDRASAVEELQGWLREPVARAGRRVAH